MSSLRLGLGLLGLFTTIISSLNAQTSGIPARPPSSERVVLALKQAYSEVDAFQHPLDGLIILVRGKRFAWAEGRLLPWERRNEWNQFSSQPFYEYPKDVPDVASWTAERVTQVEQRLASRQATNIKRDPSFFDTLWAIQSRVSADAAQRQVRFLGLNVSVHRFLQAPLARVQARLTEARKTDPSLHAFLSTLRRLEGFNWRDIAGTQSRSNHAYGTALDLIPRTYGGKTPYWLWAARDSGGWYQAAWNRRWQPHPKLVEAFEAEGFVWGGKWTLFDTIHFEYRPEILILSGLREP